MKLLYLLIVSMAMISCKKDHAAPIKLLRKVTTTYTGLTQITSYEYDSADRIIAIHQTTDNQPSIIAVTISYRGDEAILISHPNYDPAYTINKEVRLSLDARGQLLRKISFTRMLDINNSSATRIRIDTLDCMYDATGFLRTTTRIFYDSTWVSPGITHADLAHSQDSFITISGNLTKLDRRTDYRKIQVNAGTTTISGGSSQSQTVFEYLKRFPNKADFKNAAILNETPDFFGLLDYHGWVGYFEPLFDEQYLNMPEKSSTHTVERDLNGNVYFNYTSTIEIARTYNSDGFLSAVDILSPGTPFKKIAYYYGR